MGDPAGGPALYAQEKAELEPLLGQEAASHPETALYLLRPPIVLGPDAVGAKVNVPRVLEPMVRAVGGGLRQLPALPALVPDLPSSSSIRTTSPRPCACASSAPAPPGAYNIAADDVITGVDVAREFGRGPSGSRSTRRRCSTSRGETPFLPSGAQWVEVMGHPSIMDTTKAKTQLGWKPRHTAIESLRATVF